jgi:NAD(P)-dependent dehydrogenase (short-subunit alcohol dehydrogenase family)
MSAMALLEDKVALVTGAGRGIGREIALLLAKFGAKVIVNDLGSSESGEGRDETPAVQVVREIEAAGGTAAANHDSVTDMNAAIGMMEQATSTFGGIDIVVNNAGILRDSIFHKMTEDDWDAVITTHLKGSFNVSRAAATVFRQQESGCFVHMTSTSGLVGNFGQANYAAAKLGIVGLSKSIALDMQRFNVRSNCIAPFAWTRLVGTIPITDDAQAERVAKIRAMTPAKIAPLVVALCADGARDVTGQVFAVRHNEIFLMSQSRPLRSIHDNSGWTVEAVLSRAFPALKRDFYALERSGDVFSWDPV